MKIIEYELQVLVPGHGKTAPPFVKDGGYWPVGETLIGIAVERAYLPKEVKVLTETELEARIAGLEMLPPAPWIEGPTLEQKGKMAKDWIKEKKKEHG